MILSCNCSHASQDAIHGRGKRVHTPCKTPVSGQYKYKCTVCGNVKDVSGKSV